MKLLNTYDDKETAEIFFERIEGEKRLASERDATETVYNLFGQPTWKNLYLLDMFNLKELQGIIECRKNGQSFDQGTTPGNNKKCLNMQQNRLT